MDLLAGSAALFGWKGVAKMMRLRQNNRDSSDGAHAGEDEASLVLNFDEDREALHQIETSITGSTLTGSAPSAKEILGGEAENSAEKSGFLMKYSTPIIEVPCLPAGCGCSGKWKKRYFVLKGGFLFRFSDINGKTKGVPVPMHDAHIGTVQYASDMGVDDSESSTLIRVSTIRKDYTLRASTRGKRDEWIAAMRNAKNRAIKVGLGHAKPSRAERRARKVGSTLFNLGLKNDRKRHEFNGLNSGGVEMMAVGRGGF